MKVGRTFKKKTDPMSVLGGCVGVGVFLILLLLGSREFYLRWDETERDPNRTPAEIQLAIWERFIP